MTRLLTVFTVFCLGIAPAAWAQAPEIPGKPDPARVTAGTYKVDLDHTQVAFTVSHFGLSNYHGLFGGSSGTLTIDPKRPADAQVVIEIPLSKVVTTSDELTAHLKKADFFDIGKYPTATFRSTKVEPQGDRQARISGDLTLHGTTKPVVLDATFTGAGANPMNKAFTVGFEAKTTINRSDFGITYVVPLVSDEVILNITAAFEKAN
jgi:polyisoprenoid-binding protein YceI